MILFTVNATTVGFAHVHLEREVAAIDFRIQRQRCSDFRTCRHAYLVAFLDVVVDAHSMRAVTQRSPAASGFEDTSLSGNAKIREPLGSLSLFMIELLFPTNVTL